MAAGLEILIPDTDIMVDLLCGYPPAVVWLESLREATIAFAWFVVMKLLFFGAAIPLQFLLQKQTEKAMSDPLRQHRLPAGRVPAGETAIPMRPRPDAP